MLSKWVKLIRKTDEVNPFKIIYVEHPLTNDLKNNSTLAMKIKNYKAILDPYLQPPINIASIRGLSSKRSTQPSSRSSITGKCSTPMATLKQGKKVKLIIDLLNPSMLPDAYLTFLPIKKAKLLDVKHLLQYVFLPDYVTFYAALKDVESAQHSDEEEIGRIYSIC